MFTLHDVLEYLEILASGLSVIGFSLWCMTRSHKPDMEQLLKDYEGE